MAVERLLQSCKLDILVLENPPPLPDILSNKAQEWLASLEDCSPRPDVFYDEVLEFYFTVRLQTLSSENPPTLTQKPPAEILSLLLYLHVNLEGMYISSDPANPQEATTLSDTPSQKPHPRLPPSLAPNHPPPNTPHPLPSSSSNDEFYIMSNGLTFASHYLGDENQRNMIGSGPVFTLLWDERQQSWIAVYRMNVAISYTSNQPPRPLVCLTVSATVRDSHPFTPVFEAFREFGGTILESSFHRPDVPVLPSLTTQYNLLGGLQFTPSSTGMHVPFSRIVQEKRYNHPRSSVSVMRRSHRKILRPFSACHLRMFTAFVPYVNILDRVGSDDIADGAEERTVVLCLEIDTEASGGYGFCIDSLDVRVKEEGCRTEFIMWTNGANRSHEDIFPLHISPQTQFSLLYAIFLHDEVPYDAVLNATRRIPAPVSDETTRRAISIAIMGRPYRLLDNAYSYLASAFMTRWNCVVDLSTVNVREQPFQGQSANNTRNEILPIPPSPFPNFQIFSRLPEMRRHSAPVPKKDKNKPLPPVKMRMSLAGTQKVNFVNHTPEKGTAMRPASLQTISPRHNSLPIRNSTLAPLKSSPDAMDFPSTPVAPHESDSSQRTSRISDPFIVSVQVTTQDGAPSSVLHLGQRFLLEIFIFNKSAHTRSFSIGFILDATGHASSLSPVIIPLLNNIQLGPLRPDTCQSARMPFMALQAGVHTVNNLTITDKHSNICLVLSSAADIVILDTQEFPATQ